MNKLAVKKNENRQALRRDKILAYIKFVLYVLGAVSSFYTAVQYDFTFISFWTVLLIAVPPGLLTAFILLKNYKSYFYSVALFSFFFSGAFFLINNFSKEPFIKLKLPILKKMEGGRGGPYVTIQYDGFDETIAVNDDDDNLQFKHALYLNLTVKKGTFGYYIIEDRKLE